VGVKLWLFSTFKLGRAVKRSSPVKFKARKGANEVMGVRKKKRNQPQGQRSPYGWLKNNNPPCDIRALPKCRAKSKTTGIRCGNGAMRGKRVCWIHGGRSPGAPKGNRNAIKHGRYTSRKIIERKATRLKMKRLKASISAISKLLKQSPE
jgi:hypothetical protein